MKKATVLVLIILMVFLIATESFADMAGGGRRDDMSLFLSGFWGPEFSFQDSESSVSELGTAWGGTIRFFPGEKSGLGDIGLGLTLHWAFHEESPDSEYNVTVDIAGTSFDLLYRLGGDDSLVPYAILSLGGLVADGWSYYGGWVTEESTVFGGGIGVSDILSDSSPGLTIGGEMKYLFTPDFENSSGTLLLYLTLGLVFW